MTKKNSGGKTTKNSINIDGNVYVQEFDNLKFIKEYSEWKANCQRITGQDMFVENVPTLWDFLDTHIIGNIRANSKNKGHEGKGANQSLDFLEDVLEGRVLTEFHVKKIEEFHTKLRAMENSTSAPLLDPKLILFTEKTYDSSNKVSGKKELYGHYKTPEYVKRRKAGKKGKGDGPNVGPAAPSDWYSGAGNPPSMALFSEAGNKFAKPRGLVPILGDIRDSLKGPKSPPLTPTIRRLSGRNSFAKLVGIASVERYFDKAINNEVFWKGGRLLVSKLSGDVRAQTFVVSPREEKLIRSANPVPEKDMPAGRITAFKLELTGLPIIQFIQAALKRADKIKGADGYRAWVNGGEFDYRKTRREKFGADATSPDKKVISKMWQQLLWRQ